MQYENSINMSEIEKYSWKIKKKILSNGKHAADCDRLASISVLWFINAKSCSCQMLGVTECRKYLKLIPLINK